MVVYQNLKQKYKSLFFQNIGKKDLKNNINSRTHNLYSGVYTLRTMQFIVPRLPKNNVYVLTRSELTVVDDKNNAILDNFDIIPEHIIHVQNADNKLAKLRELHRKTGKKIFFVEDSFKTILNAEECMDFVEGIHISEFIV